MAHVLKHVPAAGSDAECSKVAKVHALLGTASKDVHCVVDERSRMAFSRDRNVTDAVQLSPGIRSWVVRPYIVEPCDTIGTTKARQQISSWTL